MGKHHTEIQRFRIFALILEQDFFVGKTASPRISAAYSRHRCGKVAATRGILDQEKPPALHILEQLECTGADAYRHVLAWLHLFARAGFVCINHITTVESSELLYPPTEAILKQLPSEPINQILERTYIPKPSAADLNLPRKQSMFSKPQKLVQMNLRMTEKDKKTFDRFCKKHQLRARDTLGLLLDQITSESDHLNQILDAQKALQQENERLKNQLTLRPEEVSSPREQKIKAYLQFLKTGLMEYTEKICPNTEGTSLPAFPYKRFRTQSDIPYEYPETEGFFLLTAEAVLWGRHRSRFIVGRGEHGEHLKIRYYPDSLYVGALVWGYPTGTRWLVGCCQAADGAMEAAAAFPLPPRIAPKKEEAAPAEIERRPSLNDQIANAMKQL